MTGSSATGGPILPNPPPAPAPLEDAALVGFFQRLVAGLTGADGSLVRPRWQAVPPNMPPITTTWAAIGIHNRLGDTDAYVDHDGTGDGADLIQRHEEFEVLCSFYGPGAGNLAALVRDGLSIPQNREPLQLAAMGLIGVGSAVTVPALVNSQWYHRIDMPIHVRRAITRTYPVLNLLKAAGTIATPPTPAAPFDTEL